MMCRFGFPCKLTGAGGGGCGFALIPSSASPHDVASLVKALTHELHYDCFETSVGGPGVLFHAVPPPL